MKIKLELVRDDFELNVDLSLPEQGFSAILGPSGCGKTTILRVISGLEKHAKAIVSLGDEVWQDSRIFVAPHKRSIGYVFQEPSLFPHLSVLENINYAAKRVPEKERTISADQAIELLGVARLLSRPTNVLSGGERQRVAIARALASSPKLLLMDEPLAALDHQSKQEIMPYLETTHRELAIPVVYVSHVLEEVSRLADHLVLMDAGEVTASDDVHKMLTTLEYPLASADNAGAVIEATVAEFDEQFELTYLDSNVGRFTVIRQDLAIGSSVRLRVAARDVSLTLEPQSGTSILNIFNGTVEQMVEDGNAQMTVRLLVNGEPMLARVTNKSAAALQLEVGKSVYLQAKTVALL